VATTPILPRPKSHVSHVFARLRANPYWDGMIWDQAQKALGEPMQTPSATHIAEARRQVIDQVLRRDR